MQPLLIFYSPTVPVSSSFEVVGSQIDTVERLQHFQAAALHNRTNNTLTRKSIDITQLQLR